MNPYPHLFYLTVFLLIGNGLEGQKRALGTPEVFLRPIAINHYDLNPTQSTIKSPWIVICDREGVQTFKRLSPSGNLNTPQKKLTFKDWFYVSEETDIHIKLFRAQLNSATLKIEADFEDYGWIEKKKMLLWTTALLDPKTNIELKALLVNKAADVKKMINMEQEATEKIYKGPNTSEALTKTISNEIYFVFKKEKDKHLLAKQININKKLNSCDLVGWVRQSRLENWNTRICLEPNFEAAAFLERKSNPNFHFLAYGSEVSALSHGSSGKRSDDYVIWKNDPVTLNPNNLASDGRRFKGGVVRFPMLNNRTEADYFRTGVIGEFNIRDVNNQIGVTKEEIDWKSVMKAVEEKAIARKNYDVLFVIEGTKSMTFYQETLKKTLKKVSEELANVAHVRYSAAVYRDSPEKASKKLFEIKKMHHSIDTIVNFVSNLEFARWHDNDNYTAMYYGINQAMIEADMNSQHTSIVFVFGNNADLKSDLSRKGTDECFLKTEVVASKLADFNAHFIGVQCKNTGREGAFFTKNMRSLILETANIQYKNSNKNIYKISDIQLDKPTLTDDNELKNGTMVSKIITTSKYSSMEENDIIQKTGKATKEVHYFVENFWKEISKVIEDGTSIENISAGNFAPSAAHFLFDLSTTGEINHIAPSDLQKIAKEEYKIYTEVFIPKEIKGATHDMCSFVLFVSETELENYVDVLERLSIDLMKPEDDLRKGLYSALIAILKLYTTNVEIDDNYDTNDLRNQIYGTSNEALFKNTDSDFALRDILSEKKMQIQDVRNFATSMVRKVVKLKKMLKQGKKYEFSYTSQNNTYFWIPIEYTF